VNAWSSKVHYADDPYGVFYLAASWTVRDAA
jgi:hypothetical protein